MSEANDFFKTNRELLVFTALSALVLAVYWQTTGFGFINLDDNLYVYDNPFVAGGLNRESVKWALTAFYSANWHPLTWLSHMLDVGLFGLNPGGHHATNVVLHLVNSLLAFVAVRKMTGRFWRSAVVAALFAVHPAHVESVAWVAERKDVLSTMFWLLAMWAYVRFALFEQSRRQTGGPPAESAPANAQAAKENGENAARSPLFRFFAFYLPVLGLFALGLTAKPMLVTLPFVFLLMDFWALERLKKLRDLPALLAEKIPFFVLSAVSSYVTVLAQRTVGAVESLDALPLGTRLVNALVSYAKYAATLFYPAELAVWYPYDRDFPALQIAAAFISTAAVTALCLWQIGKRKYLLMGWLWFLGTLVPVIGLVQVGSQPMADRYTYIPYFGLFIMLVWGLADVFEKFAVNQNALRGLFAAAIVVFAALSFRQVAFWRGNETLYKHTLAVTKANFLISHNLCHALMLADRLDEAAGYCRAAIEIKPDYAEVYNTLGVLELKRGNHAEAARNFRAVVELTPDHTLGYVNLSVAESLLGEPAQAEADLAKAVRLDNNQIRADVWINALNNLAVAYTTAKNYEKAADNLARIIAIDNQNAGARANLALTFYHLKRYDEAQKLIESALQLNPNEAIAFNTYGLILLAENRRTEAAGLFERALQLKPDFTEARENLTKAKGEK